ncbi:MAG: hypothetical protein ACRD68_04475, partial [Pyrinomonadaceae bacterium]
KALVRRARPDGSQGEPETITPVAQEYVLRAGDTLLEPEAFVHAPRNAGSKPLVLLIAGLMPAGHAPTVFITPGAAPK